MTNALTSSEEEARAKREEFLTARQLASVLQVSEATVRRLARKGRIPAIRLTPRITRFHLQSVRESLGAYTNSHTRRTKAATNAQHDGEDAQLSFADMLGE